MDASFDRVTRDEEVLVIPVRDNNVLRPILERVETRVGILLLLPEVDEVVLVAVAVGGAEEADGSVDVGEDEAAEVAHERLRPRTDGDEVVLRARIRQLVLDEPFLE